MKTDKEAAWDYAKENWGKLDSSTVEIMQQSFEAGCKHKEESRWIPVIEGSFIDRVDYWVYDEDRGVVSGSHNPTWERWYCSDNSVLRKVTHYQPIIVPTPPQTNK